ncbi:MAG: serine hydrolase [Anaerolineae bacterium]
MHVLRRSLSLSFLVVLLVGVWPFSSRSFAEAVPLPPAQPLALWLGLGIAAASGGIALLWALLLAIVRPPRRTTVGPVRRRPWWRRPIWAVLLLGLVAAGLYTSWRYVQRRREAWAAYQTGIPAGVQVAGIDAAGMDEAQLRNAIETRVVTPHRRPLTVHYADQAATLDMDQVGLQTNADQIVGEALQVRPALSFQDFLVRDPEPLDVQLSLTYTFAYEQIAPWVEARAAEVARPAQEHQWDPETLTFTRGGTGQELDRAAAVEALRAAVPDLSLDEVELPVVPVEPQEWDEAQIVAAVEDAAAIWNEPPLPAATEQITIAFDRERWIGPNTPAADWEPTRTMTVYTFLPGRMGWELDAEATEQGLRVALESEAPSVTVRAFRDVAPDPLTLSDIEPELLEVLGHYDGFGGLYLQDLTTGEEIRHNTYVTTSGMSMIKVAIMVTAYRTLPRPYSEELADAIEQMIAYSINAKSNAVLLAIGEDDFEAGLMRVNETLQAMGMHQTYIASGYHVEDGPTYPRIPVPEREPVEIPSDEQVDLLPDPTMQTSLSDQALLFEALYRCTEGEGKLLDVYPDLTPADCEEMLDLLKRNPTRTLLGPGFADDVPLAHKNGFGGGSSTDERMDVGIVWPHDGRPYLVGLYQWDNQDWIHWLRVWPQQIELSTMLYDYFTMSSPQPSTTRPQ